MQTPSLLNITKQAVFYCFEININWFLNYHVFIGTFLRTNATHIPVLYPKTSLMLLLGKLLNLTYKRTSIDLPLCWSPMQPPFLFSITKQAVFQFLEIYYNLFLNYQALIIILLITNATYTPVQYHKNICIVLLGNLSQLNSKLTCIHLPLFGHQCNPHPWSISQTSCILEFGNNF